MQRTFWRDFFESGGIRRYSFFNHKPLDPPGTRFYQGSWSRVRISTAVLNLLFALVVMCPGIPTISAAVPGDTRQEWPVVTSAELNVTGADITNHTLPSRYGITPALIDIKVELSGTSLPGPKGEMAAGPRTIGFAAEPVGLAIVIVAILSVTAGVWYKVKRKPEETMEEADEKGDEENGE
jgi:hypothetical protein